MRRSWVFWLLLLLVCVAFWVSRRRLAGPGSEKFSAGQVAPEIMGEDINGRPMKLSDYRGKVVVLDFWGNW